MKLKISSLLVAGMLASLTCSSSAYAVTTNFVTFDPGSDLNATIDKPTINSPQTSSIDPFKLGPSVYVNGPVAAPDGTQTITTSVNAPTVNAPNNPIDVQFSGGVILGLATFFPAIQFASSPNVYGTADFGNNLSNTLTINTNPLNLATPTKVSEVSFALFNGETMAQDYTVVTHFADNSSATNTFTNIAANWASGYALVDLLFPQLNTSISSISINVVGVSNNLDPKFNNGGNTWDFLIDDVAFNQNISTLVPNPPPINTTPQIQQQPVENPNVLPPAPTEKVDLVRVETVDQKSKNEVEDFEAEAQRELNNANDPLSPCKGPKVNQPLQCTATIFKVINDNSTVQNFEDINCQKGLCKGSFTTFALQQAPLQAVPEPENYAMMLAGFGIMGFVVRRRRVIS